MNRPLPGLFLAAIGGTLAVEHCSRIASVGVTAFLTLVALTCLGVGVRTRRGVLLASWLAAGALASLGRAATGPPPAVVETCGVARDPTGYRDSRWRARIDAPTEVSSRGARTVARLEAEACDGRWVARTLRSTLVLWEGPEVARGDLIEVVLAVEPIEPAHNFAEPDAFVRAGLDGVDAIARVRSPHLVVERGHGVFTLVDRARRVAARALDSRLSRERAAVAKGLVMGDRAGLTALERDAWADSGLAHLLAVSGMHVTMVVVSVLALVRYIGGRVPSLPEYWSLRALGALAALPCATWFCLWSAAPASALRATLMGSVGLVGILLGRHGSAIDALCLSGFIMLIESPLIVHDPGFTLSMAAVAALLLLPQRRVDTSALRPLKRSLLRARSALVTSVLTSVAATLATAPITASVFGRVSLVAPLTNLVAVPLGATLATPLALFVVAVASVSAALANALAVGLDGLLAALLVIVHAGEHLPGAALIVPRARAYEIVLYGGLLLGVLHLWRSHALGAVRPSTWPAFVCGLGLLACVGARYLQRPNGDLVVELPYVGQGDSVFITLPRGEHMLLDAGGAIAMREWDPGRSVVAPLLRSRGVRTLDLAVVSHPHPDHIGGFDYLASRFGIRELWFSGQAYDHPTLARLRSVSERFRTPLDLPLRVAYGGIFIDVIHPRAAETSYLPELDLNDNSIVLKLTHGKRSMLLTGDIEQLAENELVASGVSLRADVLKVPHHGSRTSSSAAFLDAVAPSLAVASCGTHNEFGFPHAAVTARYRERGVPFLSTAEHGAIRLISDGETFHIATKRDRTVKLASAVTVMEVTND